MLIMRYFITLMFVIILCGCDNSQMASSSSTPLKSNMNEEEPVFSFSNEVIDLGTIDKKKNEFVTTSFQFTNTGTKPLVIKKSGCFMWMR
ncbi:DUF1573 domain-containing protein [Bacteroides thetaiotaomicron]|uniref:DUF1573 domain-containing protein n=1 Tax=Bacteroides thetaiotaomicron TaxID=818 RepID=UPI0039C26548